MTAVDFIKMSLEMSKGWIMGLAGDMRDEPLAKPTPNGGNHPLWCLGHLTYVEGNMINGLIKGEPNPVAEWKELFDMGTKPLDDASGYPSYENILGQFEQIRGGTMALLETLNDDDLDKPSHAEGEMKNWFGTVGQCFASIPVHFGFHGGQIADARRAVGRSVLMG